jgi:hypothetical protein
LCELDQTNGMRRPGSWPFDVSLVGRKDKAGDRVRFIHADAHGFPFEPATFVAAFSRFGVMFCADPLWRSTIFVVAQAEWATRFSLRRTKAVLIYRRTGNRAIQLWLGYSKLESTVRYLGIEVDDAIEIEKIDI